MVVREYHSGMRGTRGNLAIWFGFLSIGAAGMFAHAAPAGFGDGSPTGGSTLTGRVVSATSGEGVPAARVWVRWDALIPDSITFSDEEGFFTVAQVWSQSAIVRITAEGLQGIQLPDSPCDGSEGCPWSTCPNVFSDLPLDGGLGTIALPERGNLSGKVSVPGGASAPGVRVDVASGGCPVASTTTAPDGSWSVGDLPAADYTLRATPSAPWTPYVWGRGPCLCSIAVGTPIPLPVAGTVDGLDIELSPGGFMRGRLLDAATMLPGPVEIGLSVSLASSVGSVGAEPNADGSWMTGPLPAATDWRVRSGGQGVFTPPHDWQHEAWPNVGCGVGSCPVGSGAPVTVEEGQLTSGIDLLLETLPRIDPAMTFDDPELAAGSGLPPAGRLELYDSDGQLLRYEDWLDPGERMPFRRLLPGTYYLMAQLRLGGFASDELWQDLPCPNGSCDATRGTPVAVAMGSHHDIDAELSLPSGLKGRVSSRFGAPVPNASLLAVQDGGGWDSEATSLADGRWYVPLVVGDFHVAAGAPGLGSLVWPTEPCSEGASNLGACPFEVGDLVAVPAGPPVEVVFVLDPVDTLFADGFETGDVARWSQSFGLAESRVSSPR